MAKTPTKLNFAKAFSLCIFLIFSINKYRKYIFKNALNKQRKNLEENFFDYERKRFWKNRFVQLFGSIFRNRRRREKIIYLVAFYKFCLHSLLHYSSKRKFVDKEMKSNLIFGEKVNFKYFFLYEFKK